MADVLIKGFKSDAHALTFIKWFSGQGEQMQDEWFSIHNLEPQNCDSKKTFPINLDENLVWIMHLQQ